MTAKGASLDELARWLAGYSEIGGRPATNQTGLSGAYNFQLRWVRQRLEVSEPGTPQQPLSPADNTDGGSLFTALPEQLGLRLERTKAPVEVIVIDHIEPPSEN